jgi:GT2 family glycosyltransferase
MNRPEITVIVTVRDAVEEIRECLASLLRATTVPHRLLLADDASTDERVRSLLDEAEAENPHVELLRNERRLGHTETVNRALERSAPDDVVLLPGDTVVTRGWLRKLAEAASELPNLATVTPLSNAAGPLSVPRGRVVNPVSPPFTIERMGRLVERLSHRRRPLAPTGDGFCLYVTRRALDRVGLLDAGTFPEGPGSEEDFCLRASELGFVHRIEDATFVYHRRTASFRENRRRAEERSRESLSRLHPGHERLVERRLRKDPLDPFRREIEAAIWRAEDDAPRPVGRRVGRERPTLLHVVPEGDGWIGRAARDLARELRAEHRSLLLVIDRERWGLLDGDGIPEARPLGEYRFRSPWRLDRPLDEPRERAVREVCAIHDVAIAHVHHLLGTAPEILDLFEEMGIPTAVSFHDYHAVCPNGRLVDDTGGSCGGSCTTSEGRRAARARGPARLLPATLRRPPDCRTPSRWFRSPPRLKHAHVHLWRGRCAAALVRAQGFTAPSQAARSLLQRHFPFLADADFRVVEPGREPRTDRNVCAPPIRPPYRIVCLAASGACEALDVPAMERLLEIDEAAGHVFDFHFLGAPASPFDPERHGGIVHAPPRPRIADAEELAELLARIAPSFALVPSTGAEAHAPGLVEAWSAGLPVFAPDLGAMRERILERGGGWLLDPGDGAAWHREMVRIAAIGNEWEARRTEIDSMRLRTVREMAADHVALYRKIAGTSPVSPIAPLRESHRTTTPGP